MRYRKNTNILHLSPKEQFFIYLRYIKRYYCCDEVETYAYCKADILAVDHIKKVILEYEFKKDSNDLKSLEWNKRKYKKNTPKPHRFYFVVPEELYLKEKEYLHALENIGVIIYKHRLGGKRLDFISMKNAVTNKDNLQKYDVVVMHMLSRATSKIAHNILNGKGE